jgi:S-(hydroxymethyl)glutathione dehydrogenase/alcohol dehydrogenase
MVDSLRAALAGQFKAAVLFEPRKPLRVLDDIEFAPLSPGQVLVKLAYAGVCQSQLMEVRGLRGDDRYLPHLLGHEGSGIVVDTASDVEKVRKGQKVILGWIKGSGKDAPGSRFRCGQYTINAGPITTFGDHAVVAENRCVPVPDGIPLDIAALFGCAVPTGAGIVSNEIRPPKGATLAVFGLGGVGMSALMATKLFDCSKVVAVDVVEQKLELATQFGATDVVNARAVDPVAAIRAATQGKGVDFAVEASGSARVIESAFNAVRRGGGLCVFASHPQFGAQIRLDPYELICGKQIRGSWGGSSDPDVDIPKFAELYREGELPLERLIAGRYPLERINEALEDLASSVVGRPLIEIDASLGSAP